MSGTLALQRKNNKTATLVCLAAMLLIGLGGLVIALVGSGEPTIAPQPQENNNEYTPPDHPAAKMQVLPVSTQRSEDYPADEFHYLLNAKPVFESLGKNGDVYIENCAGNGYYLQAEYRLQQDDDLIYRSAILPPGWSIEVDDLIKELAIGQYGVDVDIFVYETAESENYIACFEQSITLTVS